MASHRLLGAVLLLTCLAVGTFAAIRAANGQVGRPSLLRDYFDFIDNDRTNSLSTFDLFLFANKLHHATPDEASLRKLVARFDANNNGEIDWAEFYQSFSRYDRQEANPLQAPTQVHLSTTNTPSEMRVMWVTKAPLTSPTVQFGTSFDSLTSSTAGTSSTYNVGIGGWTGWVHNVLVRNLQPGTQYFYRVGDPSAVWGRTFYFTTVSSQPQPEVIATYGDMGTIMLYGWMVAQQLEAEILTTPFDQIVHVGDIAYAGTGSTWEFEGLWDLFFIQIEPLAAYIPYMVSVGNHEHYYNYTSFNTRFDMPRGVPGSVHNFWYSYDRNYVHWLMFSTEHNYDPGSPQYAFIEADLQRAVANRKNVPWIVFNGHRPLYSSDQAEYDSHRPGCHLLTSLEPLLLKYQVDLVLTGHMHCYERSYPVNNGTIDSASVKNLNTFVNPAYPVYIVIGTAGAWIGEQWVEPKPAWSAFRMEEYGYGRMTVYNGTTLLYEYRSADTGKTEDSMLLIKYRN